MNPGLSFVFTGICPSALQNSHAVLNASSLVLNPGDISTSFINCAGRQKCMPTKRSSRPDPAAISVAKSNARLNKIRGTAFQLGDVLKWNPTQKNDVITANLYIDLLIEILPKLRGAGWLILSGILRSQREELLSALQRNHLEVISSKQRGKWIAILARLNRHSGTADR